MADQILVTVKVLKAPSDKVQMRDGSRKQERAVFSVHRWTSNLGAGIHEVLTAQMQT